MGTLVLCSGCSRHVRANEAACPFCGSRLVAEPARRFASIGTGASRSRRYALRAALLAGSATASCSRSSGTAQGTGGSGVLDASSRGGAGAQGGANPGGVTSRGGASGATAGRGGAANGGANGGTGNGGVGGGALVPGRACPGFTDGDPGRVCRSSSECPVRAAYLNLCVNTPLPRLCSRPPSFPNDIPRDECGPTAPCPQDWACENVWCDDWTCILKVPCTAQNCNGDRFCVGESCLMKECDEPGSKKCPAGFECGPSLAMPEWAVCHPPLCTEGYVCPTPLACGAANPNEHGCGGTTCDKDADCPCGYCVNRQCAPQLGSCDYRLMAMPYGCVWPDEELV